MVVRPKFEPSFGIAHTRIQQPDRAVNIDYPVINIVFIFQEDSMRVPRMLSAKFAPKTLAGV